MFRYALMLTVLLAGAPFVHAAEDAASAPAATAAAAAPMSEGEIKKIDTAEAEKHHCPGRQLGNGGNGD